MSWLKLEKRDSNYDPHKRVESFVQRYGEEGRRVLDAFNSVDPLHVLIDEDTNPDEYLGYCTRFFHNLGIRALGDLSRQELVGLVTSCFHASQIGKFVQVADIKQIADLIFTAAKQR